MIKPVSLFIIVLLFTGCAAQKPYSEVLPMGRTPADQSIDIRGKTITTFILFHAVEKLEQMKVGEVLEISTDKFEAIENDVASWCRMTGHTLVTSESGDHYLRFYIKKSDIKKSGKSFAIIISDPGLENLLTPLGLALGAALKGDEVHLIFQGPAVRVLKKGFKGDLKGIWQPFSVFARKEMAGTGHLPPQDKLRQLKELGAHIYMCGPSMQHFGVKKQELIFDDVIVGEYMTFLEVMSDADVRFFLQ